MLSDQVNDREREKERERVVEWIEKKIIFCDNSLNQGNLCIYSTAYKPAICKTNEYSEPISHMNYSPTHTHTHSQEEIHFSTLPLASHKVSAHCVCVCVYCGHMLF